MTILQHDLVPASAATGYQISRSLRFNSADSAYLARTPASAGNRQKFTANVWVKRSALGSIQRIISCTNAANGQLLLAFTASDTINFQFFNGSVKTGELITTPVYRDVSGWYNILFAVDTTQATASNRVKLYVNGTQVTAFSTATYMAQNEQSSFNNTVQHTISSSTGTSEFFSGYLTEITFVDGQQLDPTSFGEFDANTGVWVPKAYTGTYGTNGWYLNFSDNSGVTATTLGKDSSGNGNNWTPNNFSVTAGVGNDSLVDSPTNYGTDTGAGGEVRGNYATLNPLRATATLANGNLQFTGPTSGGAQGTYATMGVTSGKWYFEVTPTTVAGTYYPSVGISTNTDLPTVQPGVSAGGYMYMADGQKFVNNALSAYGSSYAANDVIGVALDMDAGTITFYKNGVSQGQAYTGVTGTATPVIGNTGAATPSAGYVNFGQRPFAYTAPSGFKALCTTNLPTPAIGASASTLASKNFNVATYTGNGTTTGNTQAITGLSFQPDLVWIKSRSSATYTHLLTDAIRGANKILYSPLTDAEATVTNVMNSFDSDGFTVAYNSSYTAAVSNANSATFVGWAWNAGGSTVTNTNGTISSQVRANAAAGISIVTFAVPSGTSTYTIGHGLGVAPAMIVTKGRGLADNWVLYHKSVSTATDKFLRLNTTDATVTLTDIWGASLPNSNVFGIKVGTTLLASQNAVAYCFAEVAGFSKFGSYTGNGNADGPFVYCGFRPRWIMIKRTDTAGANWVIVDTARDTYNLSDNKLAANLSDAENSTNIGGAGLNSLDILSNGFKARTTTGSTNASGATYIFAAFAEAPFNYARAR